MATTKKKSKFKLKLRKDASPFDIKKYLTLRNALIILILVVLYIAFPKTSQAIIMIIVLFPITEFSVRTSKYIKDFSIEMLTPFSIFLGYLYGWKWGAFFGVVLGFYMWAQVSIKVKTLISIFLCGVAAYLGQVSAVWFPGNFVTAYLIVITIRNLLGFIMFIPFNTMFNNIAYTISDAFFNTFLMSIVLNVLYRLVMLLPG
ncbi:hypothetical protein JXC34_05575 [Candidatus Woesearchaeota archaeon]|nr:hypothetical protein [Candidatus Woesearchaeota archaeon]